MRKPEFETNSTDAKEESRVENQNLDQLEIANRYIHENREIYWQNFWDIYDVFKFSPDLEEPVFSIDTPPPTVSGNLHIGHVFSYTHAAVIAAFKRLKGYNIRYPMGYDDNGLPTERLVAKILELPKNSPDLRVSNPAVQDVVAKFRASYAELWRSLGTGMDRSIEISTISPEVQIFTQRTFINLFENDLIYEGQAPGIYCCGCKTPIARAEVDDKEKNASFYTIQFNTDSNVSLEIATTRPELLPSILAVFVHPDDSRYSQFVGQMAVTPLGDRVPILADQEVKIDKGTGAVMCCSYGDEQDLKWVRRHGLDEKIIISQNGRLQDVAQLTDMNGQTVLEARQTIVEELKQQGVILQEELIAHTVGVHERCGAAVEIIPSKQWYVRVLDIKEKLLRAADQIQWHPEHYKNRYIKWVEQLNWDWSISRTREYGIPIPIFRCEECDTVFAKWPAEDPVDPRENDSESCASCDSFNVEGETQVLDTWFTSSLTPTINNIHPLNKGKQGELYPMAVRPMAHDIIRTWALYSIVMGLHLEGEVPWEHLMISGHILLSDGSKVSKSKGGGPVSPSELIAEYGADALRYAVCRSTLGVDGTLDVDEYAQLEGGKKLATKLYNGTKFSLSLLSEVENPDQIDVSLLEDADVWILRRTYDTAQEMSKYMDRFEYGRALQVFENFYWNDFTDNYIEMVKYRLYGENDSEKKSAQYALYHCTFAILRMISPYLPHLAEELFHSEFVLDSEDNNRGKLGSAIGRGYFSQRGDVVSIRKASWPADEEIGNLDISPKLMAGMSDALTIISQVRAYKSQQAISLNSPLERITVSCPSQDHAEAIQLLHKDLMGVTQAAEIVYEVNPAMNKIDVVPELFEGAIQIVEEAKLLKKVAGLKTRDSIDEVKVICQSTEQMELLQRFLDYLRRGSRAEHVSLSIDEDIKKCKVAITV